MFPLKTNHKCLPTGLNPSSGDQNWGHMRRHLGRVAEGYVMIYDDVDMKQK